MTFYRNPRALIIFSSFKNSDLSFIYLKAPLSQDHWNLTQNENALILLHFTIKY